jgi:predicted RecB family nuclease
MTTKITKEILEAYLNCKFKAHLKLMGQQGTRSDYEGLLSEFRQEVRNTVINEILARHPGSEVVSDISLSAAVLRGRPSFVIDAVLEDDHFSLNIDGLKRVDGSSKLGDFHYVPILFHEGRKVGKEQRLLLETYGLLCSHLQGRSPAFGIVWHGRDCRSMKVRLSPDLRKAEKLLQAVKQMTDPGSAPRLILNSHCQVCEFRRRCHDQAGQEDSISLLRGMGEREMTKWNRKGIFTIAQGRNAK